MNINHAPKRKDILNKEEEKLALAMLCVTSVEQMRINRRLCYEQKKYGRIYMLRYRLNYEMKARNINDYPGESLQAKAIMLMIQNNLDYAVHNTHTNLLPTEGTELFFKTGHNTVCACSI